MAASDRKAAWLAVALLFLFQLINFADKAVIGIAAVPIKQELSSARASSAWLGRASSCSLRSLPWRQASLSTVHKRAGCWRQPTR
jgi:hypothetical protein